jgi:hypothetical protein
MRPSGIRRYFEIAATMDDVITLGIGEPDFATPSHIALKGMECLQSGQTGYTANAGYYELRQAISLYIERLYGLYYNPKDQILVTVGVSEAMFLALKAVLNLLSCSSSGQSPAVFCWCWRSRPSPRPPRRRAARPLAPPLPSWSTR